MPPNISSKKIFSNSSSIVSHVCKSQRDDFHFGNAYFLQCVATSQQCRAGCYHIVCQNYILPLRFLVCGKHALDIAPAGICAKKRLRTMVSDRHQQVFSNGQSRFLRQSICKKPALIISPLIHFPFVKRDRHNHIHIGKKNLFRRSLLQSISPTSLPTLEHCDISHLSESPNTGSAFHTETSTLRIPRSCFLRTISPLPNCPHVQKIANEAYPQGSANKCLLLPAPNAAHTQGNMPEKTNRQFPPPKPSTISYCFLNCRFVKIVRARHQFGNYRSDKSRFKSTRQSQAE